MYAEDNTICCTGVNTEEVQQKLQSAISVMIKSNQLQANPSKFQFIIFDKHNTQLSLKIDENYTIDAVESVKLLGCQ